MRAGRAVLGLLAELRRGDEQEPLQRARLDAREGELLALEAGADIADGVVAAGVEDEEFVLGGLHGLQELLDEHALGDGAGFAVHLGVDGGDDVAFVRGHAVAREVDEREVRARRRAP